MPYMDVTPKAPDAQDIIGFLRKPILINRATVAETDNINSVLYSFPVAPNLVTNPIWKNKVSGYRLIRGTAVCRVTINASPFQQGLYLLHFLPNERDITAVDGGTYVAVHNINLTMKTQQPAIEFDLRDSAVELSIPYVAPSFYYDFENQSFDWGTFYFSCISPLATGSSGESTADYSIFLHFEDVELSGPQFGPESSVSNQARKMGTSERRRIARTGQISGILDKVSVASDILSTVPVIGSVASMASAISGGMADLAAFLGFMKPISDKAPMIVTVNPTRMLINADGENTADVFSLGHRGQLPTLDNFAGTNIDEMSFAYLKKIPAYTEDILWSTSSVSGTIIYEKAISPPNLLPFASYANGASTWNYSSGPPGLMLQRYFKYYRGSIKYRLKFVKTDFHSGKLVISYSLNDTNSALSVYQSSYVLREIVDIRECREVNLCLPFIESLNYLDMNSYMGRLQITVLNELRVPETASNNVHMIVYVSCGDDFEYAYPVQGTSLGFVPQGPGDAESFECDGVGGYSEVPSSLVPNFLSIGDVFHSIKQLVCSSRRVQVQSTDTYVQNQFGVYPFAPGCIKSNVTSVGAGTTGIIGDYLSYLATGYVYSRGSVRLTYPAGSTQGTAEVWLDSSPTSNSLAVSTGVVGPPATNNPYIVGSFGLHGLINIRNGQWGADMLVPHFGKTPLRINYLTNFIPNTNDVNNCRANFLFTPASSTYTGDVAQYLYRAGGDDFCFGYFIGFIPLFDSATIPV